MFNFCPYICWLVIRICEVPLEELACRRLKDIAESFVYMTPVTNSVAYSLYGTNFRKDINRAKSKIFSKYLIKIFSHLEIYKVASNTGGVYKVGYKIKRFFLNQIFESAEEFLDKKVLKNIFWDYLVTQLI